MSNEYSHTHGSLFALAFMVCSFLVLLPALPLVKSVSYQFAINRPVDHGILIFSQVSSDSSLCVVCSTSTTYGDGCSLWETCFLPHTTLPPNLKLKGYTLSSLSPLPSLPTHTTTTTGLFLLFSHFVGKEVAFSLSPILVRENTSWGTSSLWFRSLFPFLQPKV